MAIAKKSAGRSESSLHIAFGIGSLMLLITTVYVFYQDHYGREFPQYQEMFRQYDLKRLKEERKKANEELGDAEFQTRKNELDALIAKNKAAVDGQKPAVDKLKQESQALSDQLAGVTMQLNFLKANYDELKSRVDSGVEKDQTKLVQQDDVIAKKAAEQYRIKDLRDKKQAEITKIDEDLAKAKRDEDALFGTLNDYRSKMAKLKGDPLVNSVLDAPMADFIAPRDKIEQVVLNNLKWSVFFADASRVDRCVSCHKGIDSPSPAFVDLGSKEVSETGRDKDGKEIVTKRTPRELKVLKSHPRLDLFVGANSKHPYKNFGCTICHGGQPLATKFNAAAHSPQDKEQMNYWRGQYDWESNENWDAKMLPLQHVEASCAKCHKGTDEVPEAAKLNEGRHLFRDRGCVNCHFGATGGPDMNWVGRVGPDLRRIGEKTDIDWTRNWIENPWDFRPSTKMPRFFGLENHKDKQYEIDIKGQVHSRDAVETEAIANYLFLASKLRETPQATPTNKGDADKDIEDGRKLFAAIGCVACHNTREAPEKEKYDLNAKPHGPDLSRIGEKVKPGWLFEWVKNPRHYWAETKMPNLRLNEEDAGKITRYLMTTMRVSKEAAKPAPLHPIEAFDKIIVDKLLSTMPEEVVRERLGAITRENPTPEVERSLRLKVKYATRVNAKGESERYDTEDGEWTEKQISDLKKKIAEEPDPVRSAKLFSTGELLIQHYGCYGCHNIQGWTYAPLTCVNLTGEADKDLDKFDFGKAGHDHSIAETKWDWIFAKISRPRVFDRDKEELIKPFDRLRMPWFGYNEIAPDKDGKESKEAVENKEHKADETHSAQHVARKYAPEKNQDRSSAQALGKEDIERLVTYVMSLTSEVIPAEMQRQPTPKDVAVDHGRRVVRELNCTGCHMVSNGSAVTNDGAATLPLAAFLALSTPDARKYLKAPGMGIYADEDALSLDYATNDITMKGFLNIQRGTFLNEATVPILFEEAQVRTSPLLDWEPLNFRIERKPQGSGFKFEVPKTVGELVSEEDYLKMTELFYDTIKDGKVDYSDAKKGYAALAKLFVDAKAFERLAGTNALKLSELKKDELKSQRKFYDPLMIKVRLTRGEGRIMNHIIERVEKEMFKNETATQQQAPPSLSYEGGKVQPDWLYQFLHNVRPLRPGLNIRMPSFWTESPASSFKSIYVAGRMSAVDPKKREFEKRKAEAAKQLFLEAAPGPDAAKASDVPDDAHQVVDYFVSDAQETAYGSQPVLMDDGGKKQYDLGKRYVTEQPSDDKHPGLVGIGCINCHSVGNFEQPIPKWAPNLANVKRRLRDDWLRRFITFPPSIYPWTNMPNNFINWSEYNHDLGVKTRGIADETKMKEQAEKLQAVRYFLMHSGDGELGTDIKTAPPAEAKPVVPPETPAVPPAPPK